MVSSTESPRVTTFGGSNQEDEEKKKVKKKRRQQKTEKQKIEESLIENGELGFGSISSENIHGPGYSTFEQSLEKIENRSNSIKFCSTFIVISFVITLLR